MTRPSDARSAAAFLVGIVLGVSTLASPLASLVGPEAKLSRAVNRVRAERHLEPLRPSVELAAVARAHARDMARNGYLSHRNPAGQDPLDRVRAAGIRGFRLLAENIGASSVSGDRIAAILESWLDSPAHRENLLNPAFNTGGVAVVDSASGRTLVVQLYATF